MSSAKALEKYENIFVVLTGCVFFEEKVYYEGTGQASICVDYKKFAANVKYIKVPKFDFIGPGRFFDSTHNEIAEINPHETFTLSFTL
jgi:hypothetical protein